MMIVCVCIYIYIYIYIIRKHGRRRRSLHTLHQRCFAHLWTSLKSKANEGMLSSLAWPIPIQQARLCHTACFALFAARSSRCKPIHRIHYVYVCTYMCIYIYICIYMYTCMERYSLERESGARPGHPAAATTSRNRATRGQLLPSARQVVCFIVVLRCCAVVLLFCCFVVFLFCCVVVLFVYGFLCLTPPTESSS